MSKAAVIADVARKVGTEPYLLDALINFETGGTYDPQIKNPYSSARGLIQITDSPARELGFRDSADAVTKFSDFHSQMYHVVLPYFQMQRRRHGPLDTRQRLYMSVFYPAYMDTSPHTEFPASVQKVNPGIVRVRDYIYFVNSRVNEGTLMLKKAAPALSAAMIALGIAGMIYWLQRRK